MSLFKVKLHQPPHNLKMHLGPRYRGFLSLSKALPPQLRSIFYNLLWVSDAPMIPKQQTNLADVRKPRSSTPETTPTNLYKDKHQGGWAYPHTRKCSCQCSWHLSKKHHYSPLRKTHLIQHFPFQLRRLENCDGPNRNSPSGGGASPSLHYFIYSLSFANSNFTFDNFI